MKVLVGVKQVIDFAIKIRVLKDGSGVELNNVKMSMNPFCEIAVEEAVKLKEKNIVSEIVAVSIGPKKASETLRTALAIGADKAIHIETESRIDQAITPLIVARAFQKIIQRDKYNLCLLGKQSIDDDFNQTAQLLAGLLGWPQITFASKLTVKGNTFEVVREIDGGLQTLQFDGPGIISCDLRLNTPRFATLPNIMKAKKKPFETLELNKLGIDLTSNIQTLKTEEPIKKAGGTKVASVDELISKLRNEAKVI